MTDRSIIFSAPMVNALLEGRKTQTRRILKLPPAPMKLGKWEATTIGGGSVVDGKGRPVPEMPCVWHTRTGACIGPGYRRGDRLWVREAWQIVDIDKHTHLCAYRANCEADRFTFAGDGNVEIIQIKKWRTPIFMPRIMSRVTLTVTEVRVQQLKSISEQDAQAEGMDWKGFTSGFAKGTDPISSYAMLWDSLHGDGAWALNPWVTAVTFTVGRHNIDEAAPAEAATIAGAAP